MNEEDAKADYIHQTFLGFVWPHMPIDDYKYFIIGMSGRIGLRFSEKFNIIPVREFIRGFWATSNGIFGRPLEMLEA